MRSSKTVAGDLSEGPQRLLRGCQLKSAGCLGLGANTSSTKVNAFSRLMAPKGGKQLDAVSAAMPKNDNDTNKKVAPPDLSVETTKTQIVIQF